MALSGRVAVDGTPNVALVFAWQAVQDITAWASTVDWELLLESNSIGNIVATPGSAYAVTVDGQAFSGTTDIAIGTNETKTLASGQVVLTHNEDGTRSFAFTFSQDFYINVIDGQPVDVVSGSGTGVLDTLVAEEPEPDEPEVPDDTVEAAGRRKRGFVAGYLLSMAGHWLPPAAQKEPVAYLYNGVRLPDIYKVYTPDVKKTHPYAVIVSDDNGTFFWMIACIEPQDIIKGYGGPAINILNSSKYVKYRFVLTIDTDWQELIADVGSMYHNVFWCNTDLYYSDDYADAENAGTLYLAASDPIPVYE